MSIEAFHAEICLSEARHALNCAAYSPEYKIKLIKQERLDYIDAFMGQEAVDKEVIIQFDEMLKQLPEIKKS
jgi:hypothetical protein|tara:strand:+ start:179 stop:394 length:216 start_codon:yes stop_codon:yes gene_type:complete